MWLAHPCATPSTPDPSTCPTPYALKNIKIEGCQDVWHRWVLVKAEDDTSADTQSVEGPPIMKSASTERSSTIIYTSNSFLPTTLVSPKAQSSQSNSEFGRKLTEADVSEWRWDLGHLPFDSVGTQLDFRVNVVPRALSQTIRVEPDTRPIRITLSEEDVRPVRIIISSSHFNMTSI